MENKKQILLEILSELEWSWEIAFWLKKLIENSQDEDLINIVYEMIDYWINQTKIEENSEKILTIKDKLKDFKNQEENQQEDIEIFLRQNLNNL